MVFCCRIDSCASCPMKVVANCWSPKIKIVFLLGQNDACRIECLLDMFAVDAAIHAEIPDDSCVVTGVKPAWSAGRLLSIQNVNS